MVTPVCTNDGMSEGVLNPLQFAEIGLRHSSKFWQSLLTLKHECAAVHICGSNRPYRHYRHACWVSCGCPVWCRGSWYCQMQRFLFKQQPRCRFSAIELYDEFQKSWPLTCIDLKTRSCGVASRKWLTYRQLDLPLTSRYCFFNRDVHLPVIGVLV